MTLKASARALALATLAAVAAAAPASASTIGQTRAVAQFGCGANSIVGQPTYAVPGTGTITSFSYRTSTLFHTAGNQLKFLILRPNPTVENHYTVVGKSDVVTLGEDGNDQTTAVTPISVEAGDFLAFFAVTTVQNCGTRGGAAFVARFPASDPSVGADLGLAQFAGEDINLAANFVPVPVAGSGATNPAPGFTANAFTVSTADGTLAFSAGPQSFNGTIRCWKVVGNAATIVAVDSTTGKADRTMVQDNGVSGDKLVNTLFDPSKLSAQSVAKFESCVAPDLTALGKGNALAGDAIQVG
jgi:hypothetical protein